MPPITIIENEFASLWYYPEQKIVHHKLKSFLMLSAYQKQCGF